MNKTINETIQDMMTNGARERLVSLDAECRESSAYERFIDNLDCSAKVKRVLRELARKTAYAGGRVIRIGKIALDFTMKALGEVCRRFPNTASAGSSCATGSGADGSARERNAATCRWSSSC